jgi:general secretion pathway protein E
MDMGIQDYLLSSTLIGVLAQRLTRKLCPHCKVPTILPDSVIKELELDEKNIYYKAVGCRQCDFTGYSGRQAVGELFIMSDVVKDMMKQGLNDHEIREVMKKQGMKTIADKLKDMMSKGLTSYEEAVRVGIMDN